MAAPSGAPGAGRARLVRARGRGGRRHPRAPGRGHRDLVVYSAAPNHEIEEALEQPVSPVRLFTLIGGLTGCAAGFAMTIWMSLDWPLLVGGKPIASIPPYVVIAFELTILMGALSTVAAVACSRVLMGKRGVAVRSPLQRRPDRHLRAGAPEQAGAIEELLRAAGAVEVRHEAA